MLQSCCSTICRLFETCIRNKKTKQLVCSGNAVAFARRSFLFLAETLAVLIVVFSAFVSPCRKIKIKYLDLAK